MLETPNSTQESVDAANLDSEKGPKLVRIPVTFGQPLNSRVRTVSGSIPARILAYKFNIPYRDALRKTGYQRRLQTPRVSSFKTAIRKGVVDVPTAILLNIRDKAVAEGYLRQEGDKCTLELDINDKDLVLYVVDGQHRVKAICELCEEDLSKWGDYLLHFVLMIGATPEQEMRQFYVVNTTAKSVKTDLALDLLKQQADADGKVMDQLIREGKKWQVDGQRLAELLNESSPIWKGKIQLANQEKGETVIPIASFINSLKPLLESPYFGVLAPDQQIKVLNAYWAGIREVCREPFDGKMGHDGELEYTAVDYTLLKGVGVTAMHELLLVVLEHVRSNGESPFDPTAYSKLMDTVFDELQGDNKDGEPVSGSDFWLTASEGGAAGSFSSSAGKRVLQAKLRQALPGLEVE